MRIIDYLAGKLGYVKAIVDPPGLNLASTTSVGMGTGGLPKAAADWVPTPAYFGFSDDVTFKVTRAGQLGSNPASFADVMDFVDACGVDLGANELTLEMVLRGIPFEIDGAEMRFIRIVN